MKTFHLEESESLDKFIPAWLKVQVAMETAIKASRNPHFNSKYADLAEIFRVAKDALYKDGFCFTQVPALDGETVFVTTKIYHISGQWIACNLGLHPDSLKPQAIGSCITYGRRYSLASICGIETEDDDGNASAKTDAGNKHANERPTPKPQLPPAKKQTEAAKPRPVSGTVPKNAEYVIKCPGFMKGKMLCDFSVVSLEKSLTFWRGKNSPDGKEFVQMADEYIASFAPTISEEPPPPSDNDIPF